MSVLMLSDQFIDSLCVCYLRVKTDPFVFGNLGRCSFKDITGGRDKGTIAVFPRNSM